MSTARAETSLEHAQSLTGLKHNLSTSACALTPTNDSAVSRGETEPAVCSWPQNSQEQQGLQQKERIPSLILMRASFSKPVANICYGCCFRIVIEVHPHFQHLWTFVSLVRGSSALPVTALQAFKSRNSGKRSSQWRNRAKAATAGWWCPGRATQGQ